MKLRATAQMLDFLRCRLDGIDVLEFLKLLDWSDIKPSQLAGWLCFQERLRDGSTGPEMVVIPAGEFLMGSPEDESERQANEGPQHPVVFAQSFAMGRYAVTFDEYDRFCEATGREKPGDQGWGRGRRPVINVSWEDTVAYCGWLSQETGAPYRLLSEAKWEYAARAGTKTAFWWGDEIDTTRANYNGEYTYRNGPKGEYRQKTVPVDAFEPNPFGLYQVHGNVWEWVQDAWHGSYEGAPTDGSA
jgi:formylglycine-generating enzyme required for sulfatase activity